MATTLTEPRRRTARPTWSEPFPGLATAPTALFLIALVLWARGLRWRLIAEDGLYLSQDAYWYFERADAFARGDWFWTGVTMGRPTHYPPGYPLALRTIDAIPGPNPATGVILLNIAAVLALTIALTRLVRRLAPRRQLLPAAVAASFLCGPRVVDLTAAPLTELVFYAAWAWSLVLVLEGRHRRPAGMTALIGLGILAVTHRYIAIPLIGGISIWIFIADGRNRRALRRALVHLAAVMTPLLGWAMLLGGIAQDRLPGELGPFESLRGSLLMFGSSLLHLQTGRIGGVAGSAYALGPAGHDTLAGDLATILALAVIGMAGIVLHRITDGFRRLPVSDPRLPLAFTTAIYVLQPLVFRVRIGHIFLDRYWGLAPILLLLVIVADPEPAAGSGPAIGSDGGPGAAGGRSAPGTDPGGGPAVGNDRASTVDRRSDGRAERIVRGAVWAIVGFAVLWSAHRYGPDLLAIRDSAKPG